MAIARPKAIGDAPARRPKRQRRMAAERPRLGGACFLASRGMAALAGRGRKSTARHCCKAIEAKPSLGQIEPGKRAYGSRLNAPPKEMTGQASAIDERQRNIRRSISPAPLDRRTSSHLFGQSRLQIGKSIPEIQRRRRVQSGSDFDQAAVGPLPERTQFRDESDASPAFGHASRPKRLRVSRLVTGGSNDSEAANAMPGSRPNRERPDDRE